jgi:hypothetical protein
MPNQPSPDSRRVTYVEDRDQYAYLEKRAEAFGTSVGELIRTAVAEKYPVELGPSDPLSAPLHKIRCYCGEHDNELAQAGMTLRPKSQKASPENTYIVACDSVRIIETPQGFCLEIKTDSPVFEVPKSENQSR